MLGINNAYSQLNSSAETVNLVEVTGDWEDFQFPMEAGVSTISPVTEGSGVVISSFNSPIGNFATGPFGNPLVPINPASASVPRTGRHTDGSNYLFCDGHVKWLRGTQVSNGNAASAPGDAPTSCRAAGTANLSASGMAATFSPI
ncbi:MAG: H-X9-DG-CTERM domain-containing protein [Janthinobacterium lividum]